MKKLKWVAPLMALTVAAIATTANATPTNTQTEFRVNGLSALSTGINAGTGLGTRTFTFSQSGTYDVRAFFDLDLSLPETGFSNEYGAVFNGSKLKSGQSWEIDEPGYNYGNLHTNFNGSGFSNNNDVIGTDDVGVGLGWQFTLAENQKATLYFTASDSADSSLFYLGQFDAFESNDPVFFYTDLRIDPTGEQTPVPEPSTFLLLGSALAGLGIYGRKRRNS